MGCFATPRQFTLIRKHVREPGAWSIKLDDPSGARGFNLLRQVHVRAHQHGNATRHRFQHRQTKILVTRRQSKQRRVAQQRFFAFAFNPTGEDYVF